MGGLKRVSTASGSDRVATSRAARGGNPRVSKGADPKRRRGRRTPKLQSDLGKEMWAMVTSDEKTIHFGCTYDEALALAQSRNGMVMTDAAANRIHGFNELVAQ